MPAASDQKRRDDNRRYVDALKAGPCVDCGGLFPPVAMDFDHVRGEKRATVTRLVRDRAGRATIDAEVAKCELVCANCHRIRTAARGQHEADRVDRGATLVLKPVRRAEEIGPGGLQDRHRPGV